MRFLTKDKVIIFGFLSMLIIIHSVIAIGIGIGPTDIKILNAMKGEEYERFIIVYNRYQDSTSFLLNVEGNIIDWVSFYTIDGDEQITEITINGKDDERVLVKFKIPEDTANGIYTGKIYVQSSPSGETGSGQAVALRAISNVEIEVTGSQIMSGIVRSFMTKDIEINYPLRIKVQFQNIGNVVAKPTIRTTVTKNGMFIDEFTYDKTTVKTQDTETIEIEWNTSGQIVGDYVAEVKLFLGGELLSEKDLNFKILERGTLTAEGRILNVESPSEIEQNQVMKIEVIFENTGEIDIKAKLIGEVYSNGEIVDFIEGDEVLIKIGNNENLIAYFKPENPGNYVIKPKVVYEGKSVEVDPVLLNVKSSSGIPLGEFILTQLMNPIMLFLLPIAIAVIAIVIRRLTL